MQKRTYAKSLVLYAGAVICLLSAVFMVVGNLESLSGASFLQLFLYIILPALCSLGLGALMAKRIAPRFTAIPAVIGCLSYIVLEGYLTILLEDPSSFAYVWSYFSTASKLCIFGAVSCLLVGAFLYLMAVLGLYDCDIPAVFILGLGVVCMLAEYLVAVIGQGRFSSPFYALGSICFLVGMILSVFCLELPAPSTLKKTAVKAKKRSEPAPEVNYIPEPFDPEEKNSEQISDEDPVSENETEEEETK